MGGKFIVLGVIILILILVVYLMHDSELGKRMSKKARSAGKKVKEVKNKPSVEMVNAPKIYYKYNGERKYHEVEMSEKMFDIGQGSKRKLTLNDRKVEERHAEIVKRVKGGRVYYEFINYAKINPSEYYSKSEDRYYYLGYREGIELDVREAFYLGDTKIIIDNPMNNHIVGPTERVGKEQGSEETRTGSSRTERFASERVSNHREIDI